LYPSGDGEMLEQLLSFLSQEGDHRAIDDFFEEFWETRRRRLQARLDNAEIDGFEDQLEVLRSFLFDQGSMPEVDVLEDGKVVMRECNCPLRTAGEAKKLPWRLEAEFLERSSVRPSRGSNTCRTGGRFVPTSSFATDRAYKTHKNVFI
jgi:predicted ArsR family transcriptional regulator